MSLPAINYLIKSDQLACVILPDAAINPDLQQLQQWLQQQQITILHYNKLDDQPFLAKLDELRVNRGLIYLFRHQIKTPLIQYFNGALANVHPSSLPDYKGPQPLYWQIRNGEPLTRLTIHKVTEELDGGDIGCDVEIDIHPFDTIKCLHQKVAQYLPYLVSQFIQLDQTGELRWQSKDLTAISSLLLCSTRSWSLIGINIAVLMLSILQGQAMLIWGVLCFMLGKVHFNYCKPLRLSACYMAFNQALLLSWINKQVWSLKPMIVRLS